MALIKCKECGKEISQSSGRCPHCGARHDYGSYAWALIVVIILAIVVYTCTASAMDFVQHIPAGDGQPEFTAPDPEIQRAENGRIKRSTAAITAFKKFNPCPATGETSRSCPGYEIDHFVALSRGGLDTPGNLQWLSVAEHKIKTRQDLKWH